MPDSPINAADAQRLLDELTLIVSRAAAATLAVSFDTISHRIKSDLSPVSAADEASEAIIIEGVRRLMPQVTIISEEACGHAPVTDPGANLVIVDPLDGTREFLAGRDEFSINLAIVSNGVPVAGILSAPAQGMLWRGVVGIGAERLKLPPGAEPAKAYSRDPIRTRTAPERLIAATSRSHLDEETEDFLSQLPLAKRYLSGSAIKFGHVSQGDADIYPRLSPVCEWDIAAGHAILVAAGGSMVSPQGGPIRYGQADRRFRVPAFIAFGDPSRASSLMPVA